MDKNQISQGTHAGVLSNGNRQLFWARFFLLALFLALSLASLQPGASAKATDQLLRAGKASSTNYQPRAAVPNCPACQQAYVECLAGGGGNCGAQLDACLAGCN